MSDRVRVVPPVFVDVDAEVAPAAVEPETIAQPEQVHPEPSLAITEVLGLSQRLFAELPLATTLLVSTHEGGRLCITTSKTAYEAALAAQVPAFVGNETSAMAMAAEAYVRCPELLAAWCTEKLREPGFRVTPHNAVDSVEHEAPKGWTVGQVLRAFGAELIQVCTGAEVPAW